MLYLLHLMLDLRDLRLVLLDIEERDAPDGDLEKPVDIIIAELLPSDLPGERDETLDDRGFHSPR